MFGAAQSIRDALRAPAEPDERWHYEPYLAAVRAALGNAVFEATLAQGQEMTLEHALEYALAAVRSGPALFRKKPDSQTNPSLEPLNAREAQITAVIARGLSNRQIAAKLGIAERTVDNHVAHILRKLGVPSRAQVAVWLTEQRLGQQKQLGEFCSRELLKAMSRAR